MTIIIPCIDNGVYAAFLDLALPAWIGSGAHVTVVSSTRDNQTNLVAQKHDTDCLNTDVWWDHGAYFNKGAALSEAYERIDPTEWVVFADADVTPDAGWLDVVLEAGIELGTLYGARRRMDNGNIKHDWNCPQGFFMLFHARDPRANRRPLFNGYSNASAYDSDFCNLWNPRQRKILPLVLRHHGPDGTNWCGAGNDVAMKQLMVERERRSGHQHERITPPRTAGSETYPAGRGG